MLTQHDWRVATAKLVVQFLMRCRMSWMKAWYWLLSQGWLLSKESKEMSLSSSDWPLRMKRRGCRRRYIIFQRCINAWPTSATLAQHWSGYGRLQTLAPLQDPTEDKGSRLRCLQCGRWTLVSARRTSPQTITSRLVNRKPALIPLTIWTTTDLVIDPLNTGAYRCCLSNHRNNK